ncbi:unnamed protein product [Prorocentrum cordatum]|uniref:Uncharacterized protein n=1 Tax=Prorocentrum cordatum TaxID=2364126 RepID=A0ABN9V0E0_9DINO|nr:unnamed protein product [Polarella glacialis]
MPRVRSVLAAALLLPAARGSSPAWSEASPLEGGAPGAERRRLAEQLERRRSELRELVLLAQARGLPRSAVEGLGLGGGGGSPRARRGGEVSQGGGRAELGRALEGADAAERVLHEHGHPGGPLHEGEGEGEGEGEVWEEEHEFEPWDTDTSFMLLGMILSVMMLFYLTNWPDDDIRLYSWQITSSTISIFCSVLLFTGFESMLRDMFETKDNPLTMVVLHFFHCFIYLAIMHVGTAVESGVMCDTPENEAALPEYKWVYVDGLQCTNGELVPEDKLCNIRGNNIGNRLAGTGSKRGVLELKEVWMQDVMEIPVQKQQHEFLRRKRRTRALSMLTGHMAGFAAISSGISLQRFSYRYLSEEFDIDEQWSLTVGKAVLWVSLLLNQLVLRMAFKLSEIFRDLHHWSHYIRIKNERSGSSAQEKHGFQMKEELMVDENIEGENEVSSLSMSYLAVNILRFGLTDHLPDEQAKEPEDWRPELHRHVLPLYGIGLLTVAIASCQAIAMYKLKWPDPRANATIFRTCNTILNATAMSFAWCVLVATDWAIEWLCHASGVTLHHLLKTVVVAGALNAFVCGAIFVMDTVHDRIKEGSASTRGGQESAALGAQIVRINVTALSILVGFSWEHCFDGGVMAISDRAAHKQRLFVQIALGIMVCVVILPAWRRYILQRVMQIEDEVPRQESKETGSEAALQECPNKVESQALSPEAVSETSRQESPNKAESQPLLSGPAWRQRDGESPSAFVPKPLVTSPKPLAWEAARPSAVEASALLSGPAVGAREGGPTRSREGSRNKIRYKVPRELTPAAADGF